MNNAALTYFIPVAEFPPEKWLKSFAVNVHGPFFMSRLVLEEMIARKSGAIVNISSGAAIGPGRGPYKNAPMRGGTLYGAEKAALERFTQGLAAEVYRDGVSVTCVEPSLVVPTPGVMFHKLLERPDAPNAEPVELMARAALLLATEPIEQGERARHVQPADPAGVRLDREGPRARTSMCEDRATRRSSGAEPKARASSVETNAATHTRHTRWSRQIALASALCVATSSRRVPSRTAFGTTRAIASPVGAVQSESAAKRRASAFAPVKTWMKLPTTATPIMAAISRLIGAESVVARL